MQRGLAAADLRARAMAQLGQKRYSAQTAHAINRAATDRNSVERALEARIKAERQRMHATGLADDAKAELMEAESWFRSITRHGHQVEAMKKLPEDMLKAMKPEADPCEDFYEYACGGFIEEHQDIPGYLTAQSKAWDTAKDTVMKEATDIFAQDDSEVGRYYQSCMATEAVEELGRGPLEPWLRAIAEVNDFTSLANFLAVAGIYNWGSFFGWKVQADSKDDDAMMLTITHIGLGLPDRSYYVEETPEMEEHRAALHTVIRTLLHLTGMEEGEAEEGAEMALRVETALATAMCSKERLRGIHAIHIARDTIKTNAPSFDWDAYLSGLGLPEAGVQEGVAPRLAVHDWNYLKQVEALVWSQFDFDHFRAYLRWRVAYIYQGYLPESFVKAGSLLNDELYGMTEPSPRWRKCYFVTVRAFKEPAAKLFVDKHFDEATEAAAMHMLANVRLAFEDHLLKLSWMDDETRANAIAKLEAMHFEVGYPLSWPELQRWRPLHLNGGFFANMETISLQHSEMEREKLFLKPDRDQWTHAATTVNAYYSRAKNALFIPAGILQEPFFSAEFAGARNYGGIGAILGHEITHGFDDNGRKYDGAGNRQNWWDKETDSLFDRKAQCMARQFSGYTVSGDKHVNGNLTLGENIADSGGLRMAYYAFLGQEPGAGALDKRAFFLSYAQLWCGVQRDKSEQAHVLSGVHSPKRWRVIGTLSDSEEFAAAFACPAGSPMNPAHKCVVW